jgi:hypothetical protein
MPLLSPFFDKTLETELNPAWIYTIVLIGEHPVHKWRLVEEGLQG